MMRVTVIAESIGVVLWGMFGGRSPSTFSIQRRQWGAVCGVLHSYRGAPVTEPLPIAVLVSGAGTNLQALLDRVHGREATVVAVASSVGDAPALGRAAEAQVPTAAFRRADYPD